MKYIISEQQFKELISKKKADRIVSKLHEDIARIKKSLKSQRLIEESIKDKVIIYKKKGLLTNKVIEKLSEENFFEYNSIVL